MDLAAGAVGSIIRKLGTLLQAEYKLQKGLTDQIEFLKQELESAHTALRKVGEVPPQQLDPQVRLWAREVRETSYDMEDILDTFLVKIEVATPVVRKDSLRKRLLKKMTKLFNKTKARHTIAGAIEEMQKRLQEVADRRDRYTIPVALPAPVTRLDPRLADMHREVAQIVGIEKTRAELIAMLLSSSHGHGDTEVSSGSNMMKIISVVGVGGLGKTTIAKAVYDQLKSQYDCAAFVSVGRKPDLVQVFKDMFFLLDDIKYQAIRKVSGLELLIGEIRKFLENKRYFIVIDDVWDITSWETIKSALDHKNSGSRVITTTRNREVASEEVYKLDPLSSDDSKMLFYMRLFGGEGKCPANYPDEASKNILDKCGGIPLAIITMASLLVGKSRDDWFEVCNSPGFYRCKDNKQVDDTVWILSLSYYDLPSHLKTCLLYLSVYPEDYLIEKNPLIWMWIAEGFIEKKIGTNLFQQGEQYFNDLVNRSMIQAVESKEDGNIYGCYVHDMVLDLIRDLADEENFVTIQNEDEGTRSQNKVRRLAFQKTMQAHKDNHMDKPQVRSFVTFGCYIEGWVLQPSFKLLRVLALEHCVWGFCLDLDHLGDLLHLRYLGLRGTKIHELPEGIGALKLLQTLDLNDTYVEELPSSVNLLSQLVCLHGAMWPTSMPVGFLGKVTSLEELHIYPYYADEAKQQFMKELGKLTDIRVLSVFGIVAGLDPSMQSDLVQSLGNLHKLQSLKLFDHGMHKAATMEWHTAVLPRHLHHLVMHGIWFPLLPSCIDPAHLPNLSHLDLQVDHVDNAGLRAVGALPELRYLSLSTSTFLPMASSTATVSPIISTDSFFQKIRCCKLDGWMVQLVPNQDSTSVSFSIGKGLGATGFGSKADDDYCSGVVATTVVLMLNLQVLKFTVPVRALYGDGGRNGSCGNLSLECLPSLRNITAVVDCMYAFADDVEKAKAELMHAAELHPNRPMLEFQLDYEGEMVARSIGQDDQETNDDDNLSALTEEYIGMSSLNGLG